MVPQGPEEAAEGSDRGVQSRQVTQRINSRGESCSELYIVAIAIENATCCIVWRCRSICCLFMHLYDMLKKYSYA